MPEAKKEWKRLAPSLIAMGILTEHDMEAFAGYCQAYARWREAEEFLSQHGTIFKTPSGYVQQVPQVSIAQQNLKIMQSFCSEFGLTPASRARLYAQNGDKADTDDPMESVLRGGHRVPEAYKGRVPRSAFQAAPMAGTDYPRCFRHCP